VVSHVVMSQVANPGSPVFYGSVSTIADMRTGTPAIGSVETGLISAAAAQLAHYYHLPVRTVAGATEAKILDIQSGFERMQSMMLAAMGGANYITCVGTLESTNLGAHELAVIDNEIIGRIERSLRGIDVRADKLLLDDIQRIGPEGHYLTEDSTLEYFKEEHFIPTVTDRTPLDTWKSSGRKGISDHAAEEVDRILREHKPRDLDPRLAEELDAYVERVKQRSTADFEAAEWED
jgi:trimethylamine--corrinoid protein Co-methyltransferase